MRLKIERYFSPSARTDENDARNIAVALSALHYWKPDQETGVVPFDPGHRFFDAVKKFQRDHGLFPDGVLRPGGDTEKEINAALKRLEQSDQVYIWCTVNDGKVRAEHSWRNGKMFRWNEEPEGGHPGEDFNCRCWAEPYFVAYQAPIPGRKPEVGLEQPIEYPDAINPVYPIETILGLGVSGRIIPSGRAIYQFGITKWARRIKISTRQLQRKYKHAKDFGISGNANNKTLAQFKKAIEDHVKSEDTKIIRGTYHKEKATHYYNPKTGINVVKDKFGNYRTNLKPKKTQLEHILRNGSLGGSK